MYQWMTATSKKVRGPINLLLIAAGIGAVIYKSGEVAVKKCIKTVHNKKHNKNRCVESTVYTVNVKGKSNEDIEFDEGEQFVVLETDGDAVLVEKLGDKSNLYFVSGKLLSYISDYESGVWFDVEEYMNEKDVETFIKEMQEIGDEWIPE